MHVLNNQKGLNANQNNAAKLMIPLQNMGNPKSMSIGG